MDASHPLGVALGQVVVDRHHVHTGTGEGIEVHRHRRHQGLAFTGLHLGDPVAVEHRSTHHLDVEVPLPEHALRRLPDHGIRLRLDVLECGAVGEPGAELGGLGEQRLVGEGVDGGFEGADGGDDSLVLLQLLSLARAEDSLQQGHGRLIIWGAERNGVAAAPTGAATQYGEALFRLPERRRGRSGRCSRAGADRLTPGSASGRKPGRKLIEPVTYLRPL